MKRIVYIIACALALSACSGKAAFDCGSVKDASREQIERVEPLSWWVGMNTPLQLMACGEGVSGYDVRFEGGRGVKVEKVHKADSPNYLFVDVSVSAKAQPGEYYLVFSKDGKDCFKYVYRIDSRVEGSAFRESFSSADMIYLIMPDRFSNGDPSNDTVPQMTEKANPKAFFGRHGGDIQGIIDHLDYIAGLGATAIWPTPLLCDNAARESYHGYACSDYYHIDPRFGSNEKYREMVSQAHKRGLKIIMDIVTNHCGTSHWWMKDLPFKDWIHQYPEYTGTNVCFSTNMDTNASRKDLEIQESGWFVPSMPDMNLDNEYVLNYFTQWAVWWIESAGIDGLRVDTYPYNEKNPMSRWCKALTVEYPNLNIVGECWTSSIPQLAYWQKGDLNRDGFNSNLPSVMDFPLHDALRAGLNEGAGWGRGMTRIYDILSHDYLYPDINNVLIFAGNHDTDRIGDVVGKDPAKMKLAFTLLATLRGIPQVFGGDEILQVSADRSQGHGGLRVDFQDNWQENKTSADLHDYVSRLFNWRKTAKAVHDGRTLHFITRDNTYAFFRYDDSQAVFVFINNSPDAKRVPWSYYSEITSTLGRGVDVLSAEDIVVDDNTLVQGNSALVVDFSRKPVTDR